ncbi:MAG: membrane dipeptidase [Acidobacteriota bacterium]|nr:membrane dipeptidase [Acidobacteriota bacterium]
MLLHSNIRTICFLVICCAFHARAQTPTPVKGYADTHLHLFAEHAYGGGWLWGKVEGSHPAALGPCDGGTNHARVIPVKLFDAIERCAPVPFIDREEVKKLDRISLRSSDTGLHGKWGAPSHLNWPKWDSIAHQQAWEGWLEQAHQEGLSLLVVTTGSFRHLCEVIPAANLAYACDEMQAVDRQLKAVTDFAASRNWVEIALTPQHARAIINSGKLALILHIETTEIFGKEDWATALDRYYQMGVRSFQLTHQLDNRFAGAAHHNFIFHLFQHTENCHRDFDCFFVTQIFFYTFHLATITLPFYGFDLDANCRNTLGLTPEGFDLVKAMMDRHMLIDLAHLSEKSVADVATLTKANNYYPLYISHGHFREIMEPKKQKEEKTTPAATIQLIKESGGIFGLRTAHEQTRTYLRSGVTNSCHGSARSFAQAYQFGVKGLKVNMAFATDMNGFIQQTRPRFGPEACSATFRRDKKCQSFMEAFRGNASRIGTDFDEIGLARIDLLEDLRQQLRSLGVDTTNLDNSAESFIRMWERAYAQRNNQPVTSGPIDIDGITYREQLERKDAYLKAGIACRSAQLSNFFQEALRRLFNLDFSGNPEKRSCMQHCRVAKRECNKPAKETKKVCKSSCTIVKGHCKTSCKDNKQLCFSRCPSKGSARRKCRRVCRRLKRSCARECRKDKRECRKVCRIERREARAICREEKRVCKLDCRLQYGDAFSNLALQYRFCRCSI